MKFRPKPGETSDRLYRRFKHLARGVLHEAVLRSRHGSDGRRQRRKKKCFDRREEAIDA